MKQLFQSLRSGETLIEDVPRPAVGRGQLLINTSKTLISAGTERMLVDFGKAGLIGKAKQQPDKVRMVLQKLRTDGVLPTIESVLNKLDQPLPLGYCNVGVVAGLGGDTAGFEVGDRVVSNGKHAEIVSAPRNLCAKIPECVSDEEAAFTVLGAIGLQGVRLAAPTLGESVVVSGLGLIGLVTVQILRANGCRVLGLDFDKRKLEMARSFGAEVFDLRAGGDPVDAAMKFSRGRGVDAVLVTAATSSSEPMHQAAKMSRKRGRIVLVGVTGLELSRADFYAKELSFQVSCSYGPGRYDPAYEDNGQDYPVGFVRWTEQRNFEAVLDLMAAGALNVKPLITHNFNIDDAEKAYELVTNPGESLGILLDYPESAKQFTRQSVHFENAVEASETGPKVTFIGSGNYATAVLIPAFKAAGASLQRIVSRNGASGTHAAKKFGFRVSSTDVTDAIQDADANAVAVCTRHDTHAELVIECLRAGKHVFVEKPLALSHDELDQIEGALAENTAQSRVICVGFNRRFSPFVVKAKELLQATSGPNAFVMTVNAGAIPEDHWTQNRDTGGGRIIGEACHFVDLLRHLAGFRIMSADIIRTSAKTGDTASISLSFEDGSIGSVHYFANGSKSFPKERLEIFSNGAVLQLDNFRSMRGFGWKGFSKMSRWKQDKGQSACTQAFLDACSKGTQLPIPMEELFEVSRVCVDLANA